MKNIINLLQEFSVPLIIGVIVALVVANGNPHLYHDLVHANLFDISWFNMHFLVNEVFMVFFFGIAAKEIVESFLPGGALSPMKKAINPLLGTLGGVIGPVVTFFVLTTLLGQTHLNNGWGIPTATDIALAWLAARMIFGKGHPAINFLLLLAIVDDAIGLGIIAIFYGDPAHPADPMQLFYILLAMAMAFGLRKMNVQKWALYIAIPGAIAWYGLHAAHLHPALALVFIVPFLPSTPVQSYSKEMFKQEDDTTYKTHKHSPLEDFEHRLKTFVDFGLFFFAFANAGVEFSAVSTITWIIFVSLIFGKVIGITFFSGLGSLLGIPLPTGMTIKHLPIVGMIAGIGLTVALFVSGAAYQGTLLFAQGPAKMGALFSGAGFIFAFILYKMLKPDGSSQHDA
jgi:NhaA family Na+:H+ antiporter